MSRHYKLLLAVLGIAAMISAVQGVRNGLVNSRDLQTLHLAGQLMMDGVNVFRLQLEGNLDRLLSTMAGEHYFWSGADYFPSAHLPVLPLTFLPWFWAKGIWICLNLAVAVSLWWVLARFDGKVRPSRDQLLWVVLIWLAGTPFRVSIGIGQNSIMAFSLLLVSLRIANTRPSFLAGLLLAVALIKYALIWPFVLFFLLLGGHVRVVVWAGAVHLVTHLLLCMRMRADPFGVLLDVLRSNTEVFHRNEIFTFWMPGRMLSMLNPGWESAEIWTGVLLFVFILGWLIRWWMLGHGRQYPMAWLGLLSLFALVAVTPKIYSFVVLAVPLLLVVSGDQPGMSRGFRIRVLSAVVYLTIIHRIVEMLLPDESARLAALYVAFNPVLIFLCIDYTRWFAGLDHEPRVYGPSSLFPHGKTSAQH